MQCAMCIMKMMCEHDKTILKSISISARLQQKITYYQLQSDQANFQLNYDDRDRNCVDARDSNQQCQ